MTFSCFQEETTEKICCSLFTDPLFVLFVISNFLTSIGFNVPYVYLSTYAQNLNMTEDDGAYLISIIGVANTVGRIVLGYLSDKPWVNRLIVYNTSLTIAGTGRFRKITKNLVNNLENYVSFFLHLQPLRS